MKIDNLTITDFGPYRGENRFDLRTTPESPIILFGGKNGAGKTTLFQAVQLCLHGKSALGRRTSNSEYEDEIRAKLHQSTDGKADQASVELQFQYANLGDRDTYVVKRSWRDRGKSIAEDLTVKRNGEELSDLDSDQWEDFLKELVPPGVSQLFFFDGEKVQKLASAIENNSSFEDSLRSLLGLDLVERLEADLSIYLSNKLDEGQQSELRAEMEELNDELDELSDELHEVEYEIADKRDEVSELEREISQREEDLAQQGGAFAQKRSELKGRRAKLESKQESLEEQVREVIMGQFAFTLVPDLCRNVRDRLQRQAKEHNIEAAREEVAEEIDTLLQDQETILSESDLSADERADLAEQLQSALLDKPDETTDEHDLAASFSERQRQRMYSVVERALAEVPEKMAELTTELEATSRELNEVEQQINRAPEEETISPLIEEINELNEQKGELQSQLDTLESKREDLDKRITYLETERDRKLEKQTELEDISDRAELAKSSRQAVKKYQQRLTERKLSRLEEVLTTRYRQLSNKSEFYQHVHIDEESLAIEIETSNGAMKQQSQLSAGERQIFATAIIWALAEISDRPLPFIVDTPMGRLDKEHRENLVKYFFPQASHQVIVLSTDTEITDEYYEYLSDQIASQFHLNYDEDEGYTEISGGYFDDEQTDTPVEQARETNDSQVTIDGYNE
ncbi:DNA sulfur modification protein DndD [Haloarcula sp. S1AR25-5A]|uniref:DNA sulfur modification protein DndD n=1 Tax=Haloarcula terrestris TaxID=2950533 RepID=A0AAE4JJ90_9EURY|nr:DNA sulfur modification protein DndD [Haloarcula terrestris]MDS0223460.1 DNA sulfur modification protein DndD [Haloarcula terrestris]